MKNFLKVIIIVMAIGFCFSVPQTEAADTSVGDWERFVVKHSDALMELRYKDTVTDDLQEFVLLWKKWAKAIQKEGKAIRKLNTEIDRLTIEAKAIQKELKALKICPKTMAALKAFRKSVIKPSNEDIDSMNKNWIAGADQPHMRIYTHAKTWEDVVIKVMKREKPGILKPKRRKAYNEFKEEVIAMTNKWAKIDKYYGTAQKNVQRKISYGGQIGFLNKKIQDGLWAMKTLVKSNATIMNDLKGMEQTIQETLYRDVPR